MRPPSAAMRPYDFSEFGASSPQYTMLHAYSKRSPRGALLVRTSSGDTALRGSTCRSPTTSPPSSPLLQKSVLALPGAARAPPSAPSHEIGLLGSETSALAALSLRASAGTRPIVIWPPVAAPLSGAAAVVEQSHSHHARLLYQCADRRQALRVCWCVWSCGGQAN